MGLKRHERVLSFFCQLLSLLFGSRRVLEDQSVRDVGEPLILMEVVFVVLLSVVLLALLDLALRVFLLDLLGLTFCLLAFERQNIAFFDILSCLEDCGLNHLIKDVHLFQNRLVEQG